MVRNIDDMVVDSKATLREAMQIIDENGLGIVFVVKADDTLSGVATDGDIRRGILGGVSIEAPIAEVMQTDPFMVRSDWSPEDIQEWIGSSGVQKELPRHGTLTVPILNEEDVVVDVGHVTSDGDLLRDQKNVTEAVNTVLVIGGAGYIGSVLSTELVERGYDVRVLDLLIYGREGIEHLRHFDNFTFLEGDMRSIETVMDAINGVDAVVHLGALVGDPASSLDAQKTLEMNYHSTKMIAEVCRYHQINRFIFASTCSVYGKSESEGELLIEESELNPVSLYAQSKIESERALLEMQDENFSPTVFRMATIYGLSPRMRFDLVVNIMSAKAYHDGVVSVFGGDQYRPLVHVRDAAQAYIDCLEAPIDQVGGEVFNVGSNDQNYRITEVGELVAGEFPDAHIDRQADKEDERSYQVDFSKVRKHLGYETSNTIPDAAQEIREAFEAGELADYKADRYSNYRTLENNNILRTDG